MRLRDLPTQAHFDTSTDNLLRELIVPALSASTVYDRGVGYFTSNWLKLAASGLAALAANGGHARIIASPKLSPEDCAAMAEGVSARGEPALLAALQTTLADLEQGLETETLVAMAWMVADGLLDFKLAIPTQGLDGDFHDKFGVFGDGTDAVAFRGSPNDSERAFRNYESLSVYYSWLDSREATRVAHERARFERIWTNKDLNLRVFDLPSAIRKNLIEFTQKSERPYAKPAAPAQDPRWRHQSEAQAAFLDHRNGVLEMATGTGKTRTALSILNELHARELVDGAIVTAFGTDLLDQWRNELLKHTSFAIYVDYAGQHEALSYLNGPRDAVLLCSRQNLAELLPKLPAASRARTMLIFDEVHGMGSESLVERLRGQLGAFDYRMGLSATPERAYDQAGNDFIESEIGPVIFRFPLEEAIRRGILCEFDYVDLDYEFSDEDRAAVRQAIRRHHAKARTSEPSPPEQLYREIARIRKLSTEKLAPFQTYVRAHSDGLKRCLIFVETAEYGALVQDILMDAGSDYHTYYGDDDRANLRLFARGDLECLVTCKRISEGIDIRSVNTIVLFAAARARLETVQRLGRCLRVDPNNPDKRARVIDFIRTDDLDDDETDPESTADEERRDWFRELAAVRREALAAEDLA
jgi:superfamily II DNA or RNA helicase